MNIFVHLNMFESACCEFAYCNTGSQIRGPRAACGPQRRYLRPATHCLKFYKIGIKKVALFILQRISYSNPAKLLLFSLPFTLAEPHAGAGNYQRWRQTDCLHILPFLSVSVCVVNRPVASVGPVASPSGGHHETTGHSTT